MQQNHIRKVTNGQVSKSMQSALALAANGVPVFPVDTNKRPLVKWKDGATTDENQIRKWWKKWPNAMPAFPTGEPSGIAVLDLDRKDGKDGVEALRQLSSEAESPFIIETKSGGLHLWFAHKPDLRCTVGQDKDGLGGVDVRGERGFAVAPGAPGYAFTSGDLDLWVDLRDVGCLPHWPDTLPMQPRAHQASSAAEPSGLPFDALRSALMSLPIQERERLFGSDAEWFKVCRVIADETGASEEGCDLWHEWSDGWGGYDHHAAESKWNREDDYDGARASVWTILQPALANGWTHPDFEAWQSADLAKDFEDAQDPDIADLVGTPIKDHPWGTPMMQGDTIIKNQHNADFYLGMSRDSILPGLRHNEMTHRDEWAEGEVNDKALSTARKGVERAGMKTVAMELVVSAVQTVATDRSYHPVREWLTCQKDDGHGLLDHWLSRYLGAADSVYTRAVGRMFGIQMVARIMEPGCKADYMPVLHGGQGLGKSSACRALSGGTYFSDSMPAIRGDNPVAAMEHLQGIWLVEVAEMASMREAAQEDMKSFLSRQTDRFRVAYGRTTEAHPRQCVFIGTTNKDSFLRDETGGRRFWPVECSRECDPNGLARDRGQLFAEALAAYRAGERWWPDREFEREHLLPMQQEAFGADPWEERIEEILDKPEGIMGEDRKPRREITVNEIMEELGVNSMQQTRKTEMRIAGILKDRLGWVKVKSNGRMVWRRQPGAHLEVVK